MCEIIGSHLNPLSPVTGGVLGMGIKFQTYVNILNKVFETIPEIFLVPLS
jgi:hypothetical protein